MRCDAACEDVSKAEEAEGLHRYLTTRLALPDVTAVETAPVLRTLKSASPAEPPGGVGRPVTSSGQ